MSSDAGLMQVGRKLRALPQPAVPWSSMHTRPSAPLRPQVHAVCADQTLASPALARLQQRERLQQRAAVARQLRRQRRAAQQRRRQARRQRGRRSGAGRQRRAPAV